MIHDNSIFCPVGHGRHSLAVAKSRSAECLLYDWRCQQSTLTLSVWKQTFHRFGIKRLHASTAKESSASSSEQTLNPGPCVAWSTCLYTEFLWNRHVTQSTLNDNWRDAHDKNTNSSFTVRVYSCNTGTSYCTMESLTRSKLSKTNIFTCSHRGCNVW